MKISKALGHIDKLDDKHLEETLNSIRNLEGETYDINIAKLILRTLHERHKGFEVEVYESSETVIITDTDGVQDDIYMQGWQASDFIIEAKEIYNATGHITMNEAWAYLALPYVENIWN